MADGYYTTYGYWGCVDGMYILFANEADYLEYLNKEEIPNENSSNYQNVQAFGQPNAV